MRRVAASLQANCALGAVVLATPMVSYLPAALWLATHRCRKYMIYGSTLTVLGLVMLYFTVAHLSVNLLLAQMIIVPLVMALVSFLVHRLGVFSDRELPKHTSLRRYFTVRATGAGVSRLSFVILVPIAGVSYLAASVLITLGLAGPTYLAHREWSFAQAASHKPEKA